MKLLLLLALVGCASTPQHSYYSVYVDAMKAEDAPSINTFYIKSGMKGVKSRDLQFKEYAEMAANTLENEGYTPASEKDAEMVIELSYSIGEPRAEVHSRNAPVFDKPEWGSSSNITGYRTIVDSETVFTRRIKLNSYSRSTKAPLWSLELESEGYSNNLKAAFPFMLLAGAGYFNSNATRKLVNIQSDNNPYYHSIVRKPASTPGK